jgi:hypothetical protein
MALPPGDSSERKKIMRRLRRRLAFLAVLTAGSLALAAPASAQGNAALYPHTGARPDVASSCDDAGLCINLDTSGAAVLNDWNDDQKVGAPIKMYQVYQNNFPVESFNYEQLTGMCSSGFVSPTCPFTVGSGFNIEFEGDPIVQIFYNGNGDCVATNGSGEAVLGACATLSGTGGTDGVIDVLSGEPNTLNCYNAPYYCQVANRYWFDNQGIGWLYGGSGSNGTQVYLNSSNDSGYWGNITPDDSHAPGRRIPLA